MDEWRLFWVGAGGTPAGSGVSVLDGWRDLAGREEGLKIRTGQPILIDPTGRSDPRLSEIFRHREFARKAQGTKETYAPDYRLFFTFLWQRGLGWDQATDDDLDDWEDWRRRAEGNPGRIGGAKWARELAALSLFYKIAKKLGYVSSSPVLTHTMTSPDGGTVEVADLAPTDVRSSNVKWLSPRGYRLWRDVGLCGMLPSGLENPSWPGRNDGRDGAFADFTYSSGLRRREVGTLLTWELPPLERFATRRYHSGWVSKAMAKRAGRFYYVSEAALRQIDLYRIGTRDAVIRKARHRGRYEQMQRRLLLREISDDRRVLRWSNEAGRTVEAHVDEVTVEQRVRMLVEVDEGLEPAMLWLTETGMPMDQKSWTKVFKRASLRCKTLGMKVYATPKMLRHSMALRVLVHLHHALDRRLGLTPSQRKLYEETYGSVWTMVKDLLGHQSELTTRDIYLEPVRGLQIESLLNDEENPGNSVWFSELARRTGLILDAA
ncbi:site-specific integrase [Streptomyces sp. NPDC093108]|uniref:site-specific integrase n=1 Tax=Streptomyces sp. NPDC093108 TaxID=3366030 RepID=UPI00380203A0